MSLSMADAPDPAGPEAIRGVYRRNAAGFDARRAKVLFERGWIELFLAATPEGSAVLSLGCGTGEPMERAIIERGQAVTGVDFAPEMLALARGRFPGQELIEADMRELDLGRRFGGVLAWNSLFHLTRDHQRAMFAVFARHAAPGAALMFTCGPRPSRAAQPRDGQAWCSSSMTKSWRWPARPWRRRCGWSGGRSG